MLGSFRFRLFVVLLVLAAVLVILNVRSSAWYRVQPVLEYMMKDDYDINRELWGWFATSDLREKLTPEKQPVSSTGVVQSPCAGGEVIRHYGWHWDSLDQRQKFSPGVAIRLPDSSVIRAVLGGTVERITQVEGDSHEILVRHGANLVSVYRGMKEVVVSVGDSVRTGQVIGKSRDLFEFELRNQEGPLNPEPLFQ